jgi:hypothetical protein
MKRLALAVLVAVAALAPAAAAKELTRATVCGAQGCRTTENRGILAGFENGGMAEAAPRTRARFYTVRMTMREGQQRVRWSLAWVPSTGLLRASGQTRGTFMWTDTSPTAARWLTAATSGLRAFPAERLALGSTPAPAQVTEVVNPPRHGETGSGFPWLAGGLALAAVLAVGGFVAVTRRRDPSGPRRSSPAATE